MVAACHDPVVLAFEKILFTESFVPTGHKRNTAQPRCDERAPGRRAAEGVNCSAPPLARQSQQNEGAAQYHNGIVARNIERNELATGCGDVRYETAHARQHDGTMAGSRKDTYQLDRACIGSTAIERGYDNQHSDRSFCGRRYARCSFRYIAI